MITTPAHSSIRVDYELGHPRITIPEPIELGSIVVIGLTELAFGALCVGVVRERALAAETISLGGIVRVLMGDLWLLAIVLLLLVFLIWLISLVARLVWRLTYSKPETFDLMSSSVSYDSGARCWPKRTRIELNKTQLDSLDYSIADYLTIEDGQGNRLCLAADTDERERDWLFDVLCDYYGIAPAGYKPDATLSKQQIN